ncbi:hypothetical protein ABFS83_06G141400 [Erythranthe nasuta]
MCLLGCEPSVEVTDVPFSFSSIPSRKKVREREREREKQTGREEFLIFHRANLEDYKFNQFHGARLRTWANLGRWCSGSFFMTELNILKNFNLGLVKIQGSFCIFFKLLESV